jgi:phenylacetate-coenzyme A ligase PaaK-like adenylate-forming protein
MTRATNLIALAHELVSIKVLVPLFQLQRLARPSCRGAMLAFQEGMHFRHEVARWNDKQKREWILRRLRYSVRRANNETAYYRELFARVGFDPWADFGFDDFARLPVLEREAVQQADKALVSASVPPAQLQHDATGGSTGKPTEVWLGPEERGWRVSGMQYYMDRIGIPMGSRIAALWGHHLDPVASDSLRDRLRDFVLNHRRFDCFRLSPTILTQYHTELENWHPRCILAYASALGNLAETVRNRGWLPSYPTRCLVTGAEKLMPHHRSIIESVFARPVYEQYGSRDVGLIGFQVDPEHTLNYQIDWANVLIEPETTGAVSSILVTKLHADGMPMLRYRIGDIGHFPQDSRLGHPTFVLHEILGRDLDRIWLHDGRCIHSAEFPHMMKDYAVSEFQVVQYADFSVVVRIVPRSGFMDESRKSILQIIGANLPGLKVSLQIVEHIQRSAANKLRPVISEIDGRRLQVTR